MIGYLREQYRISCIVWIYLMHASSDGETGTYLHTKTIKLTLYLAITSLVNPYLQDKSHNLSEGGRPSGEHSRSPGHGRSGFYRVGHVSGGPFECPVLCAAVNRLVSVHVFPLYLACGWAWWGMASGDLWIASCEVPTVGLLDQASV